MGLINKSANQNNSAAPVAIHALKQSADDMAGLIEMLTDTDVSTRRAAAKALRYHTQSLEALITHLYREPHMLVIEAVFDSLLYHSRAEQQLSFIIPRVIEVMRSAPAQTRNSAIVFLSGFANAMSVYMPVLLADDSADIQLYALDILRSMNHPLAAEWLEDMLNQDLHINVLISVLERIVDSQSMHLIDSVRQLSYRYPNEPLLTFSIELTLQRLGEQREHH